MMDVLRTYAYDVLYYNMMRMMYKYVVSIIYFVSMMSMVFFLSIVNVITML